MVWELVACVQNCAQIIWQFFQLLNYLGSKTFGLVEAGSLCEPQCDECQTDHLSCVGFSRGYRKLSTAVDEDAAVILSSQGAIDFVDDVDALEAMLCRHPKRNQKIHSFTGLAYTEHTGCFRIFEAKVLWSDLRCYFALYKVETP